MELRDFVTWLEETGRPRLNMADGRFAEAYMRQGSDAFFIRCMKTRRCRKPAVVDLVKQYRMERVYPWLKGRTHDRE